MSDPVFHALRRRLAFTGGRPSHASLETLASRRDEAGFGAARVIEPPMRAIDPGPSARWNGALAFLDGVQRTELLGHVGTMPLLAAKVSAGVRLRIHRKTQGVVAQDAVVLVGRQAALDAFGTPPADARAVAITHNDPPHPIGDLERARALVDRARIDLELSVARAFRREHPDAWLIVDGTITASTEWSTDTRMVGVIKSHSTLWFADEELESYLTLPAGCRTSVFVPETRQVTPVHSWALRLWPWAGHDLMHGLVRVETAEHDDPAGHANQVASWLLAERAPLADDPRKDRLLYGVHDVERWLRARSA
jgi:hypothetical protein